MAHHQNCSTSMLSCPRMHKCSNIEWRAVNCTLAVLVSIPRMHAQLQRARNFGSDRETTSERLRHSFKASSHTARNLRAAEGASAFAAACRTSEAGKE
eukprot:5961664-Pleurochrysis_carterae.AAC.2